MTKQEWIDSNLPSWIKPGIEPCDIDNIIQGGCASGAYMPAVTYYQAVQTMGEHGDAVLEFIEDHYGEIPQPPASTSWSGIAVHYLSFAVELWASMAESEIEGLED